MKILLFLLGLASCASQHRSSECLEATEMVKLPKKEAGKIQGNVARFLSDAQIHHEQTQTGESLWRFKAMPEESVYHLIGLRNGDGITKTNLGPQKSFMNLVSDLSGIGSGTTDCLYVTAKDSTQRVIKIKIDKD